MSAMNARLRYILSALVAAGLVGFVGGCQSPSEGYEAPAEATSEPTPPATVTTPSASSETEAAKTAPGEAGSKEAVESAATAQSEVPEEASVNPGINETFLDEDLDVSKWVERFERKDRAVYAKRKQVLEAVDAGPGDDVADVGAGTGFYTMLFAEAVQPDGQVYAVEIAEPFLRKIEKRASEAGLENVKTVKGADRSTNLPENSIDLAFLCDVYHHFEYPQQSLTSIHSALRPGGELILIEFKRDEEESSDWVLEHVRAGKKKFTAEVEAAGFEKTDEYDLFEKNYMIRFQKQ